MVDSNYPKKVWPNYPIVIRNLDKINCVENFKYIPTTDFFYKVLKFIKQRANPYII